MKAGIKIQSFSDIITNSSSEVFVSESSEELINALNELDIKYDCFETEERLRDALESGWYDFDELVPLNIYRDIYYYIDELRKYKTDDEIWDFIKPFYTDLIGKIIVDVDRDYLYAKEDEKNIYLRNYIKE